MTATEILMLEREYWESPEVQARIAEVNRIQTEMMNHIISRLEEIIDRRDPNKVD